MGKRDAGLGKAGGGRGGRRRGAEARVGHAGVGQAELEDEQHARVGQAASGPVGHTGQWRRQRRQARLEVQVDARLGQAVGGRGEGEGRPATIGDVDVLPARTRERGGVSRRRKPTATATRQDDVTLAHRHRAPQPRDGSNRHRRAPQRRDVSTKRDESRRLQFSTRHCNIANSIIETLINLTTYRRLTTDAASSFRSENAIIIIIIIIYAPIERLIIVQYIIR